MNYFARAFILIIFLSTFGELLQATDPKALEAPIEGVYPMLDSMTSVIKAGDYGDISSILISKDGALVYENYFAGTKDDLRNTRSATKTVVSMLIGIAIDQGHIASVSEPIMKYLKKRPKLYKDARKKRISIEDLLTMSSILECNDFNSYSAGNEERMYLLEDWTQFALDLPIRGFAPWETKPQDAPYGRGFRYCTAGVFLLGRILENATGMTVRQYAEKYLFNPLEIAEAKWAFSPLGEEQTGGGLELTSKSLHSLGELYRLKGKWGHEQLVDENWVSESLSPKAQIDDDTEYGYLWWLKSFGNDRRYLATLMSGSGGNKVFVFNDIGLTVVITSTNFGRRDAHDLSEKIVTDYVLADKMLVGN